ncbi:MAG: hypothetical protein R3326_02805, partial [Gemmatimonadota bacterium]|nr:hypothetical protein [Gemmatimonadota bacterium]
GLVASTPWSSHLGLTRPYTKERWVVGVPPERSLPDDLEGVEIAVPDAGPAAAWVKDAGARPVRLHDLARASGPVAAPEWKIREIGYRPTGRTLHTVRRVLAAPPGENGLIVHLERHLHETRQRGEVPVSP